MGPLHKSRARNWVLNFLFSSRKQCRPSAGEDFYWIRTAGIQAGLPHVWKEPGTFAEDGDGSKLITCMVTFSSSNLQCADCCAFLCRFPADRHVCRFWHHDRQAAGWDHSAYPTIQSNYWQDKVRQSPFNAVQHSHYALYWWVPVAVILIDYLRQNQSTGHRLKQHFLWSVDGSRDCKWILRYSVWVP